MKVKINKNTLNEIIKESIRNVLLKESNVQSVQTYCPGEWGALENIDVDNAPAELQKLLNTDYQIKVGGNQYSDPTFPGGGNIDDIKVLSDGGLSQDIMALRAVNPELAGVIENEFDKWLDRVEGFEPIEMR